MATSRTSFHVPTRPFVLVLAAASLCSGLYDIEPSQLGAPTVVLENRELLLPEYSTADAVIGADITMPFSGGTGTLFEIGSSGHLMVTQSDSGGINVKVNNLYLFDLPVPADGRVHTLVIDIQVDLGRVRVFADGELIGASLGMLSPWTKTFTTNLILTSNLRIYAYQSLPEGSSQMCSQETLPICDEVAECIELYFEKQCKCPEQLFDFSGDGTSCSADAVSVRSVLKFSAERFNKTQVLETYASLLQSDDGTIFVPFVATQETESETVVTLDCFFKDEAEAARRQASLDTDFAALLGANEHLSGPRLYRKSQSLAIDQTETISDLLAVEAVFFEDGCFTTGCWVFDVVHTELHDSFNVLFLPRAEGVDAGNADPWYSQDVRNTWLPTDFPCEGNALSYNSLVKATACCISAFTSAYRVASSFLPGHMGSFDLNGTLQGFPNPDPSQEELLECAVDPPRYTQELQPPQAMFGELDGLEGASSLEPRGLADSNSRLYRVRVRVDQRVLQMKAGMRHRALGGHLAVDSFVGLARFRPAGVRFLHSEVQQVNLHLENSQFMTVSAHGMAHYRDDIERCVGPDCTDGVCLAGSNCWLCSGPCCAASCAGHGPQVRSVELRLHQIDVGGSERLQFVQLVVTPGERYTPNPYTGVVPLGSVAVGLGGSASEPVLAPACASPGEGGRLWQEPLKSTLEGHVAERKDTCGPDIQFCQSPEELREGLAVVNIPLGMGFLSQDTWETASVYVEAVVALMEDGSLPVVSRIRAEVPVEGGVVTWCSAVQRVNLEEVLMADVLIGATDGAVPELQDDALRVLEDVGAGAYEMPDAEVMAAAEFESALLTLVLRGEEGWFTRPEAAESRLVVEELVTIHTMEAGGPGSHYAAVLALLRGLTSLPGDPAAFTVERDSVRGPFRFTLQPTPELRALCEAPDELPTPGSLPPKCIVRRDVSGQVETIQPGRARPTVVEIPAVGESVEACGDFVEGWNSSRSLGQSFALTLQQRYSLNGKWMRAFWINPGYEWTPHRSEGQSKFWVSQGLFVVALVALDEGDRGIRRRLLAATTIDDKQSGFVTANVVFNTSADEVYAAALGLPSAEHLTIFSTEVGLTSEEACMEDLALRQMLKSRLSVYVLLATKGDSLVQVLELSRVAVDRAGLDCPGDRRAATPPPPQRRLRRQGSTARVEVVVGFSGLNGRIDMEDLQALLGRPDSSQPPVQEAPVAQGPDEPEPEASEDEDELETSGPGDEVVEDEAEAPSPPDNDQDSPGAERGKGATFDIPLLLATAAGSVAAGTFVLACCWYRRKRKEPIEIQPIHTTPIEMTDLQRPPAGHSQKDLLSAGRMEQIFSQAMDADGSSVAQAQFVPGWYDPDFAARQISDGSSAMEPEWIARPLENSPLGLSPQVSDVGAGTQTVVAKSGGVTVHIA